MTVLGDSLMPADSLFRFVRFLLRLSAWLALSGILGAAVAMASGVETHHHGHRELGVHAEHQGVTAAAPRNSACAERANAAQVVVEHCGRGHHPAGSGQSPLQDCASPCCVAILAPAFSDGLPSPRAVSGASDFAPPQLQLIARPEGIFRPPRWPV